MLLSWVHRENPCYLHHHGQHTEHMSVYTRYEVFIGIVSFYMVCNAGLDPLFDFITTNK